MLRYRRRALIALSILVLGAAVTGGVVAASQSSDEQALQPARHAASPAVEARVNSLLAHMTLEEKLQQIQLLPDFMVTDDDVRKGLGAVLSETRPERIRELQRIALEAARRWGQVVVLKGGHSVVATPDGDLWVCPAANPALASAGTGDTLAGIIAGFLAQGVAPADAAVLGLWVGVRAMNRAS